MEIKHKQAEEKLKIYDERKRQAYGDIKIKSKIEIKRTPSFVVEIEQLDESQPMKIDAVNDDEDEMKLKIRLNIMK